MPIFNLHGRSLALTVLCLTVPAAVIAGPVEGRVRHAMTIVLDPATHTLGVSDVVQLPARPADGAVDFVLNAALRLTRSEPAAREVPLGADATFFGINGTSQDLTRQAGVKRYRVPLGRGADDPHHRLRGGRQLRPVRPEGAVHAGLPRDGGDPGARGRLPGRQRLLVSVLQP